MQNKDKSTHNEPEVPSNNKEANGKINNDNKQDAMLNEEIEIDAEGKETIVKRAHNADGSVAHIPEEDRTWNENESLSRGVTTEEEAMKTVENEDLNSDITANRYPNSHPDNHKDRGNMKLGDDE
ncbi:hypothetical protein H8R23_07510 [Flavobacterium sp. F-380]|uniref:Uncharacterized protein n=1 Tax=Flavobacterium kayseriense TaxID=2764714 RepID=A0ABR7J720_9FLAO|nr:hypothetical protein [Flavobacterium kayseriense]MBC5841251.1 hypothetical protein [Flavobacterium kayseriense]MBC5847779.1 hypothetical protein [Flavobacterium kayseriense]MBU0939989.1 hypothetical protein [Bacteroidota bacterium]